MGTETRRSFSQMPYLLGESQNYWLAMLGSNQRQFDYHQVCSKRLKWQSGQLITRSRFEPILRGTLSLAIQH